MEGRISEHWAVAQFGTLKSNLKEVKYLENELRELARSGGDWSKVRNGEAHLKPAFDSCQLNLGGNCVRLGQKIH